MPPCTNTQGRKTYLDGPTVADFESYWHSKSDEAGCVRMWNGRDLLFQWGAMRGRGDDYFVLV